MKALKLLFIFIFGIFLICLAQKGDEIRCSNKGGHFDPPIYGYCIDNNGKHV